MACKSYINGEQQAKLLAIMMNMGVVAMLLMLLTTIPNVPVRAK
jgi:hypothetical protein